MDRLRLITRTPSNITEEELKQMREMFDGKIYTSSYLGAKK